jgi:pimeloyl-ACP methyl ester carboxylesterase
VQVEPDHRKPDPPRVVLVPGLGLDERSSARLRADLASSDRGPELRSDVVLLPGMGRKGPVPALGALAAELLARLGEGPVVLVGHSQGCQVAAVAATDPRVSALVLLGPTTDPRLRRPAALAGRWVATAAAERWTQVPRVVAQWTRTGARAMVQLWHRASPDRTDDRLRAVRVQVTVVRGTRDRLCPRDWADRLASAAPRGRLVELPGAAHMTVQTRPAEVARLVRAAAQPS